MPRAVDGVAELHASAEQLDVRAAAGGLADIDPALALKKSAVRGLCAPV
jgi:hypothetical protein